MRLNIIAMLMEHVTVYNFPMVKPIPTCAAELWPFRRDKQNPSTLRYSTTLINY